MSSIIAKKPRKDPLVMTLDMYGRLKVNQALAFNDQWRTERAQATAELRRAIELQNKKSKQE